MSKTIGHIDEYVSVSCPLAQAAHRIRDFFRDYGNAGADTAKLDLRVDVLPGLPALLELERSVIVSVQTRHLPADTTPRFGIQWAAEVPGPFPLFAGDLSVDAWTDYDSFRLRLSGNYSPPLGLAGRGFDVAVGHRIARATAMDLLERIRRSIERGFQADEAAKPS